MVTTEAILIKEDTRRGVHGLQARLEKALLSARVGAPKHSAIVHCVALGLIGTLGELIALADKGVRLGVRKRIKAARRQRKALLHGLQMEQEK
jgi:hypothetical protein